jgi:hypothetical protein
MAKDNKRNRKFNCTESELPSICERVAFSLERDLQDFTAYSPKFNSQYLLNFKGKITIVSELVNPKMEIAEQKIITNRLYGTMNGLIDSINQLQGYVKLAKTTIPISLTDFGLTTLRQQARSKDAEGAQKSLQLVNANILKYKDPLTEQGLNEELTAHFTNAAASIGVDNQKQYEIKSNRMELVDANMESLNELFALVSEILEIGKILYKGKKPLKQKEYTFDTLKKTVRAANTGKKIGAEAVDSKEVDSAEVNS